MSNEKINLLGLDFKSRMNNTEQLLVSDSIKDVISEDLIKKEISEVQKNTWNVVLKVEFKDDDILNLVGVIKNVSENKSDRSFKIGTDLNDAMFLMTRFMLKGEKGIKNIDSIEFSNTGLNEQFKIELKSLVGCEVSEMDYKNSLATISLTFKSTSRRKNQVL